MDDMNTDVIEANTEENNLMTIEKLKAVQEVQASLVIAKRFPRDENLAYKKIMKACERIGLAENAIYKYTKTQAIEGPTIRLAEVCAQNFGNIDYGIKELLRDDGRSVVMSYCWDLETNTKRTLQFEVNHVIDLKDNKKKTLTSDRDIYEHIANYGSRRLRNCILGIIPKDFVDDAVLKCKQTIAKGNAEEPLSDRVRKLTLGFGKLGVSIETLEIYLGHSLQDCSVDDFVNLMTIFTSLRDKLGTRADFFDVPEDKTQDVSSVIERLKKVKETPPEEWPEIKVD